MSKDIETTPLYKIHPKRNERVFQAISYSIIGFTTLYIALTNGPINGRDFILIVVSLITFLAAILYFEQAFGRVWFYEAHFRYNTGRIKGAAKIYEIKSFDWTYFNAVNGFVRIRMTSSKDIILYKRAFKNLDQLKDIQSHYQIDDYKKESV